MENRRVTDRRLEEIGITIARMDEKFSSSERALLVAKSEIDRRLNDMNELRAQIASERGEFVRREKFDADHDTLVIAISNLQKFQWGMLGALGVLQFVIGILLHYWHGTN